MLPHAQVRAGRAGGRSPHEARRRAGGARRRGRREGSMWSHAEPRPLIAYLVHEYPVGKGYLAPYTRREVPPILEEYAAKNYEGWEFQGRARHRMRRRPAPRAGRAHPAELQPLLRSVTFFML